MNDTRFLDSITEKNTLDMSIERYATSRLNPSVSITHAQIDIVDKPIKIEALEAQIKQMEAFTSDAPHLRYILTLPDMLGFRLAKYDLNLAQYLAYIQHLKDILEIIKFKDREKENHYIANPIEGKPNEYRVIFEEDKNEKNNSR